MSAHCGRCKDKDHTLVHPNLGCADVGCTSSHQTSPAPRRGEAATGLREAFARAIRGAMIPGTMVGPDHDDYAAADAVLALTVAFEVGDDWPTPNHCRRAAAALDALSPARYGAILRAYADAEDARSDQHGSYRAALASSSATEPESAS